MLAAFGHYVQPEAVHSGIFSGFGAYVQPGAQHDGIFGGLGAAAAADGLRYLSQAEAQVWQLALTGAHACPVASPSPDVVAQFSVASTCPFLGELLNAQQAAPMGAAVALVSVGALAAWVASPSAATSLAVQVVVTQNPQVIAQLAGPTGQYAVANLPPTDTANALLAQARGVVKASAAAATAAASVAGHVGTTVMITLGLGVLVLWLMGKKRR
jgi:hypothetical protein